MTTFGDMNDRAPRFKTPEILKNPRVGPATYVLYEPAPLIEPVVPFLSLESHGSRNLALQEAAALPGPGAYTIKYRKHRIKGGNSLRYTSARTSLKNDFVPSPVTYDPHHRLRNIRKPIVEKPYKGPPPRYGSVHGVSVPPSNFLGYVVDNDVIVGKVIADTFNSQLTSKFVPFPGERNQASLRYKGITWGKSSTVRFPEKVTWSPGPGDYELGEAPLHPLKQWDEEVRAQKRASCPQPRMSQIVATENERLDFPGPPAYIVDYSSYYAPRSYSTLGSFSRAERFIYLEDSTPGPATYNVKDPCSCTSKGKKTAAFLTRDVRLRMNRCQFSTPGPADYTLDHGTIHNFVKNQLPSVHAAFSAPFNSTVERCDDLAYDSSPGAPDYDIKVKDNQNIESPAILNRGRDSYKLYSFF